MGGAEALGNDINDVMNVLHGRMNEITAHPLVNERSSEAFDSLDVCGLNYMRDAYAAYAATNPDRITFGSETLPPDIAKNWEKVREISSCIGDFTWTGWDYIGEAGVGVTDYNGNDNFFKPYPVYLANVGDIDITGYRRPMSYWREIVFGLREKPYIAVQDPNVFDLTEQCTPWTIPERISGWTWPGREGKQCKVDVYSPAQLTVLYLNGARVAEVETGPEHEFHAEVILKYQVGILEAVGYTDGKEIGRFELKTASSEKIIRLQTDTTEIKLAQYIFYVDIFITDREGILHTEDASKISLKVEGPAVLAGFGSADPKSCENFFDTERTIFRGHLLAAFKLSGEAGKVTIIAECENAVPASMSLYITN